MLEGGQNGQPENYAHNLSFTRLQQTKAKVNTEKEQSSHDDGYEEHMLKHSGKYVQILKDGKQKGSDW